MKTDQGSNVCSGWIGADSPQPDKCRDEAVHAAA